MGGWIKGAIKRPGAFRAKAKAAGMGTAAYARHVLQDGSRADERTKRQARLALTLRRLRGKAVNKNRDLVNTGWTDEARAASLAVRRAKAAERKRQRDREREQMFDRQRQNGGRNFIENWYPRGRDGRSEDPHYGTPTPEAPYGYIEGTMEPRKEPLYDRYGRPIVPRPWEDYHRPKKPFFPWQKDESLERDLEWLEKVDAAEKLWGRFGRKKEWMDAHPNATEAEWEAYDKERLEEWKSSRQRAVGSGQSEGQ
jgi:hypothetical protein